MATKDLIYAFLLTLSSLYPMIQVPSSLPSISGKYYIRGHISRSINGLQTTSIFLLILAMASFNVSSRKSRSSGALTKSSRSLLRKRRPQPLARINEEDETINAPISSPRIGSAEEDSVLYNAVSSLMDVDSLRDKGPKTTSNTDISQTGLLYVVNPDPEPQLSDLSLSLEWGRLSVSPRSSNASMRVPDKSNNQDSDIVPAPLRLKKMPFVHNPANSMLFQTIAAAEAHSDDTGIITDLEEQDHPKSATEEALEHRLAETEHQTAELRKMFTICEAKMSQMANELLQAKSEQLAMTSESSADSLHSASSSSSSSDCYSLSSCSTQMQDQMAFMNVDIFQDAKQAALVAHLNLIGMSAQRHRHRLPQVLVG